jgi:hypothetical protein
VPATPYGIRLLRMIRNPAVRLGVIAGAIALPVLLLVFGGRGSGAQTVGMLLLFVALGLFSPTRYRRRGFWRW